MTAEPARRAQPGQQARDRFDVVIVGSGPSGSTYARTIKSLRPDASVLVVESGPVVSDPPGRHVRSIADPQQRLAAQIASQGPAREQVDVEALAARANSASRGRTAQILARPGTWLLGEGSVLPGEGGMPAAALSSNVGGMGSHWTGACPTPGRGEWIDDIPADLLSGAFDTARRLLRVRSDAFAGAPLGDEVRALLAARYDAGRAPARRVQPMPLAIELGPHGERYWTGPDAIFGDLLSGNGNGKGPAAAGFELRAQTTALRILTSAGRATGVLLHDRASDAVHEVGARFVVVAADAFRTPQLLHASGIRPAALGHYLNDQPQVTGTVRLHQRLAAGPGKDGHNGRSAHAGAGHARRNGSVDVLSGVSWVPFDLPGFPFHGQIMQLDASPVPVDASFETWPGSIVECGLFAAKDITREDRLEFDDDTLDDFGLPAIRIHYDLTDRDRQFLQRMIVEVRQMADLLGEPVNGAEPLIYPNGSSIHYQGTTRLGSVDDGTSVCDPHSRVWGTSNVYVGGNGVIPTPTACNPTLTNVALSVLGAQDVSGRLD